MKRLALVSMAITLTACEEPSPPPQNLLRFCESESGSSRFYLAFDTREKSGQIRYQYFGQDVLYRVTEMTVDGAEVTGRVEFAAAATGETRGNPWEFAYNYADDTLVDGSTTARCSPLQEPSQANLPPEVTGLLLPDD